MLVWKGHKAKVRSLAFSPDGRYIITTSGHSRFVWLWEATTGQLVRKLSGSNGCSRVAVFFPDGKHIAATQERGGCWVCEVETGNTVAHFRPEFYDSDTIAVSPDGTRLFTCNWKMVTEWTQPTRPHTTSIPREPDHTYPMQLSVCPPHWFSHPRAPTSPVPRGTCTSTMASRWKEQSGNCAPRPVAGQGVSSAFAFNPDETSVVVAFGYFSAIWRLDEPDQRPVRCGRHKNLIRAVGFLPGGGTALSAAMDGTLCVCGI